VIKSGGAEILIPLVEGMCVSIDTAGRKIVVEPPEGLVELNITRRQRF
jgi:ribosomal 30S subunit maturation factor RimM